jgi:hypothetical protein
LKQQSRQQNIAFFPLKVNILIVRNHEKIVVYNCCCTFSFSKVKGLHTVLIKKKKRIKVKTLAMMKERILTWGMFWMFGCKPYAVYINLEKREQFCSCIVYLKQFLSIWSLTLQNLYEMHLWYSTIAVHLSHHFFFLLSN